MALIAGLLIPHLWCVIYFSYCSLEIAVLLCCSAGEFLNLGVQLNGMDVQVCNFRSTLYAGSS